MATTTTLTIQTAPVLVKNTAQPVTTDYDPNLGSDSVDPIHASTLENTHLAWQGFKTGEATKTDIR